ncbi:hypothetical protein AZF37_01405 [endosymbiont 'TC1' of Trimyema compressum]|uniref:hypothetical protein n=1 Tax=endosymbiont 'TC1' of Trimyema compressum TaxID=243899 RepID=UPI0007F0BC6F|nr:hypothetical protein [endosymbiont 'TC1' of Trimyema compressum]AMP20011.1 hypothetical protein AZF37_01405 [endosymbiont 'TC1' of Trimyema compressum]
MNTVFLEFLELRKSLKAKNTDKAIRLLVNQLNKASNDSEREQMLNNSIVNSWEIVYEIKGSPKRQTLPFEPKRKWDSGMEDKV